MHSTTETVYSLHSATVAFEQDMYIRAVLHQRQNELVATITLIMPPAGVWHYRDSVLDKKVGSSSSLANMYCVHD